MTTEQAQAQPETRPSSVHSDALLACVRYHEKWGRFERRVARQMVTKKWRDKCTYRARKHERFAEATRQANDPANVRREKGLT